MIKRFEKYVLENKLFQKGDRLLVAVSGGLDSMALCNMLKALEVDFAMAHCNFKLRGEESDKDEYFVKQAAKDFDVECYTNSFDTQKYADENSVSIQMAARDLRYNWFEQIRKENDYHWIVTAHHLNDNIETFMLNVTKGTGIKGLRGILSKTNKLIRPLLFASRTEIEGYANEQSIQFREDSSNSSIKYQRNKIRHEVVPILQEINPSFEDAFATNFSNLRDVELMYNESIATAKKKLVETRRDDIYISIRKLLRYGYYKSVLFEILKDFGFNSQQSNQVLASLEGESGKQFLSEKYKVVKDRKHLIISELNSNNPSFCLINVDDKTIDLGDSRLKIEAIDIASFKLDASNDVANVDFDKLTFPLTVRRWKKGDYFYPFGMKKKKKKVSDFFVDNKVSLTDKENAWIIESNQRIVWVVGYRIDERFRIDDASKKILQARIIE